MTTQQTSSNSPSASQTAATIAKMTYEDAVREVVRMKNEGLNLNKIEKNLKNAGYVSKKTRRPVSYHTIRNMIADYENIRRNEMEEAIAKKVTSREVLKQPMSTAVKIEGKGKETSENLGVILIQAIKKVAEIDEIKVNDKLLLIKALIVSKEREESQERQKLQT